MTPLLVDENLLGLTRWLRFLGYDAAEVRRGGTDRTHLDRARTEGRCLVTGDEALAAGDAAVLLVPAGADRRTQLRRILNAVGRPAQAAWFSRCVVCNVGLERMDPDRAATDPRVPPGAAPVWRCPTCGRAFWQGSHFRRTLEFLKTI